MEFKISIMPTSSKRLGDRQLVKPLYVLLATLLWVVLSVAVPLGTTTSLIGLSTLIIVYFLARILSSIEALRASVEDNN